MMKDKHTGEKTRVVNEIESQIDEKMKATHVKKVYSFTEDEKRKLEMLEMIKIAQDNAYIFMRDSILGEASTRVGRPIDKQNTIFNLQDGVFIVYVPKHLPTGIKQL